MMMAVEHCIYRVGRQDGDGRQPDASQALATAQPPLQVGPISQVPPEGAPTAEVVEVDTVTTATEPKLPLPSEQQLRSILLGVNLTCTLEKGEIKKQHPQFSLVPLFLFLPFFFLPPPLLEPYEPGGLVIADLEDVVELEQATLEVHPLQELQRLLLENGVVGVKMVWGAIWWEAICCGV
ncbi:class II aminoacyl-tRNA and biotin synthetasessuperfamily protein [Striga asiatica]|uniref:Class II aminoacyl-tRNA and biotin synthetasessuperfamily protein n=1 Tax=Striga asiatica TaxID=4170 RepID=A0A5A7QFD6_STRAF|nr:class II aminoacyl-tRNA and biotin synthetasessuperfamily protein [Striga asiatica]